MKSSKVDNNPRRQFLGTIASGVATAVPSFTSAFGYMKNQYAGIKETNRKLK